MAQAARAAERQKLTVVEMADRTSATIAAEIEALRDQASAAEDRLAELDATYDAAILKGDDAAEKHEAEVARVRRTVKRVALLLPPLEAEHADVVAREEAERIAGVQAAAEEEIDVFVKCFPAEYREHADFIASLMLEFARLEATAHAAGIPGVNARLRRLNGRQFAEQKETFTVWISPDGVEHASPPIPTVMVENGRGELVAKDTNYARGWRQVERTKVIPARSEPGGVSGHIVAEVRLPGIGPRDPAIFPLSN